MTRCAPLASLALWATLSLATLLPTPAAAQGVRKFPADALPRLEHALSKPTIRLGAELPRRSLAALAALGDKSPLVTLSRAGAAA